mgnify:CR=1 FL=1
MTIHVYILIHCFFCTAHSKAKFSRYMLELIHQQKNVPFQNKYLMTKIYVAQSRHTHSWSGVCCTIFDWCSEASSKLLHLIHPVCIKPPNWNLYFELLEDESCSYVCMVFSLYVLQVHLHHRSLHWNCSLLYALWCTFKSTSFANWLLDRLSQISCCLYTSRAHRIIAPAGIKRKIIKRRFFRHSKENYSWVYRRNSNTTSHATQHTTPRSKMVIDWIWHRDQERLRLEQPLSITSARKVIY